VNVSHEDAAAHQKRKSDGKIILLAGMGFLALIGFVTGIAVFLLQLQLGS